MMKKYIYGFLAVDIVVLALLYMTGQIGTNIDAKVAEFDSSIKSHVGTLVDVRTPQEYTREKIDGALNVDWKNSNFKSEIEKLDKEKPVLIYCRSGKRAGRAKRMMKGLGFKKVVNLKGGINQWKAKGMPTKKGPGYKEHAHGGGEEGC